MSRWLQNVGTFLDQLDTKAAVVVTSAVSGRNKDDDDDDDDDDHHHHNIDLNQNLQTRSLLYPSSNSLNASMIPQEENNIIISDNVNTNNNNHSAYYDCNDGGDADDDVNDVVDVELEDRNNNNNKNDNLNLDHFDTAKTHDDDDDELHSNHKNEVESSMLLNQSNHQGLTEITLSNNDMDVVDSNNNDNDDNNDDDGWNNDDDEIIDNLTERSDVDDVATTTTTMIPTTNTKEVVDSVHHIPQNNDNNIESLYETVQNEDTITTTTTTEQGIPESSPLYETADTSISIEKNAPSNTASDTKSSLETEVSTSPDSGHLLERITILEQELQNYQNQYHRLQQEKQNEIHVLTKEARNLRRHLTTINEQLAVADREVGAQRQELENAAQRFEKDQMKYKHDIQSLQSKHNQDIQQMKLLHQDAISNLQVQSKLQIDILKQELSDLRQQRQQEGGDWNKELADAIQREDIIRHECKALIDERDTLLNQIDTLRSQQELLGSRLESLTTIADQAAIRERDAEIQLDNAMTLHAKQLNQRQARENELERTVSELSALLVVERSKHTNVVLGQGAHETLSTLSEMHVQKTNDDTSAELEVMKSQLELERQQNSLLRKEMDNMSRERQEEILVSQTRQTQHDKKISDLTQQLLELRATIRDAKHADSMLLQQRQNEESKLDAQRVQELSEELIRMRERMSASNSEAAALRNRLQTAINRAIVAEAAAESAYTTTSSDINTWSGNSHSNHDPELGLTVRRRGTNQNRASNSISSSEAGPTIRKALRLDSAPGGIGKSTQSIGKSLDMLDGFLAQSGEILRFNAIARLCFVVYLLLLHLWTFALLTFHIHGFETIHASTDGNGVIHHGPGALMQQQSAVVNASTGN